MFLDHRFYAVGCLFFLNGFMCQNVLSQSQDLHLYFPETKDDGSAVRWASGNTLLELQEAKNATMIEADVKFVNGITVISNSNSYDLKLEIWIDNLLHLTTAGFKLNFKNNEAIEPSLKFLKQLTKLDRPVWFAAELVEGPGKPMEQPLGKEFLTLCSKSFPNSTLSVGWTSSWSRNMVASESYYSWKSIWEMINILREEQINQPINFAFKSHFAYASQSQIRFLLNYFKQSSILIWSEARELVNVTELLEIRKNFQHSLISYNIGEIYEEEFLMKKNNSEYNYNPTDISTKDFWNVAYRDDKTYITPKISIIYAGDSQIKSKLSLGNSNNRTLTISGKISQFGQQNTSNIQLQFYESRNILFNCSLSINESTGCSNYSFYINNTNPINPCYIFHFGFIDMGKYALYQGNIKFNACNISFNYNTWKWDDTIQKQISWELLPNFHDVRVKISAEPAQGYLVLEGVEVNGEPGESWKPEPGFQNHATHLSMSLMMFLIIFLIV